MNRRPIAYRLVYGDIAQVHNEVWRLVEEGWWLYGELIPTSTGRVARELVKYAPIEYVMPSDGDVVPVREE